MIKLNIGVKAFLTANENFKLISNTDLSENGKTRKGTNNVL